MIVVTLSHRQLLGLIGLTVGLVLLASLVTVAAAHGGDASKIHGCVGPVLGNLRVVGANESCRPNETALDWSAGGGGSGLSGYQRVEATFQTPGFEQAKSVSISCPAGKKVLSGGYKAAPAGPVSSSVYSSYPSADESAWILEYSTNFNPTTLQGYAICATAS